MIVSSKASLFILLSLVLPCHAAKARVTPMAKVISLLKDLSAKIAAEGSKEAAQYDKFACFCKEQGDQKRYARDKSKHNIDYLRDEINELETARAALIEEMTGTQRQITGLEDDITDITEKSRHRHDDYLDKARDLSEGIDACSAAIDSLTNAKKQMLGAKVDLMQVTSGLVRVVKRQPSMKSDPSAVALLSMLNQQGCADSVTLSGGDFAQPDFMGTYSKKRNIAPSEDNRGRAIYESSKGKQMFFWADNGNWIITNHGHVNQEKGYAYAHSDVDCPEDAMGWKVWVGAGWSSDHTITASVASKPLSPGAAAKYESQSNHIIALLQDLLKTFRSTKKDLDDNEKSINNIFESKRLGLAHQRNVAEKDKAQTGALVESKTEELHDGKEHLSEEETDHASDEDFLEELYNDCKAKAELFDENSKTRASELSALATATEKLEAGAAPNYKANKQLIGLQTNAATELQSSPVTLVQLRRVQRHTAHARAESTMQRVNDLLADAADRLDSNALANIAWRVKGVSLLQAKGDDHFVKVRSLIRDLMQKLTDDAADESDHKTDCDKALKKRTGDRDGAQTAIEKASGELAYRSAERAKLQDHNKELDEQLLQLRNARIEANDLYDLDFANKKDQIDMSEKGADAVTLALDALQDFYGPALLQFSNVAEEPPPTDREGNTVEDLAPATNAAYHGSSAESKGVIGILEVILADFKRTNEKATIDRDFATTEHAKFETETKKAVDEKDGIVTANKLRIVDLNGKINELEDTVDVNKKLLKTTLEVLEDFKADCVDGEHWDDRAQKRTEEIEALKEAHGLLEDWQR